MSDQNEFDNDTLDSPAADMPPPQEDMRSKGVKKSNRLVVGGFVVVAGVLGYFLIFAGAGSNPAPMPVETGLPSQQQGPGFLTDDRGGPVERVQRIDNEQGGIGRERADVLTEIDEREDLLARIERGETAVMFEELDLIDVKDEDLEEYQTEAPVFGDLPPRERPTPAVNASNNAGRTAMTNTPILRPQPSVERPSAPVSSSHSVNPDSVAYELALLEKQKARGANELVSYTPYEQPQPVAGVGGANHPMTPGVNATSPLQAGGVSGQSGRAAISEGLSQGELALPGDKVVAYMSTRISSDQPDGRAMAEILEGPLRGGKLLGAPQFQGERLLVNFNQLVFEGSVYDVQALAIDTSTEETSVADGINRRLLTRYGVPILAGVASIGIDYQSVRNNPSVTQTNEFTGETVTRRTNEADSFGQYAMEESTDHLQRPLGDIAANAANTPIHVWANPGAIGVLFVSSVPQG